MVHRNVSSGAVYPLFVGRGVFGHNMNIAIARCCHALTGAFWYDFGISELGGYTFAGGNGLGG